MGNGGNGARGFRKWESVSVFACGSAIWVVGAGACASSGNGVEGPDFGGDAGMVDAGASPIQPSFPSTVTASTPPPSISGGTLLVLKDGMHAVAADPDRDAVYIVDLGAGTARTVALKPGDEPGRGVEDGTGMVHIALRGGGAVVTVDPSAASVTSRQTVCPAPRGITWDSSADLVWVACATGELVALPSAGGTAVHSFVLDRDLRDVVVTPGGLAVSQFRSARVLRVGPDGSVTRTDTLPAPAAASGFAPQVAWRVAAGPSGTLAAVHQEESVLPVTTTVQGGYGGCGFLGGGFGGSSGGSFGGGPIPLPPPPLELPDSGGVGPSFMAEDGGLDGGEGEGGGDAQDAGTLAPPTFACGALDAGGFVPLPLQTPLGVSAPGTFTPVPFECLSGGIVRSVVTVIAADGTVLVNRELAGVLPVDLAVSPDGAHVAAVAPGNMFVSGLSTVFEFDSCGQRDELATTLGGPLGAQPIAVAFDKFNDIVVQTREPAQLWIIARGGSQQPVTLSSTSRRDAGHDIFHVQAGAMIACASCHPEGRDDGHVWSLDNNMRRTPSLSGTIAGTAPYHWPGDMKDLNALVDDVYTVRMAGAKLASNETSALDRWVQAIPALPAPSWVDANAASRGKTIFERSSVGCATCHSGTKFTNNQTMDVGTGGAFQVPPLVGVGWRTPLLHDGCAATIADRFGSCGSSAHGNISSLSPSDITDLSAYLETL